MPNNRKPYFCLFSLEFFRQPIHHINDMDYFAPFSQMRHTVLARAGESPANGEGVMYSFMEWLLPLLNCLLLLQLANPPTPLGTVYDQLFAFIELRRNEGFTLQCLTMSWEEEC